MPEEDKVVDGVDMSAAEIEPTKEADDKSEKPVEEGKDAHEAAKRKKEWDKERQKVQQEFANYRKASEAEKKETAARIEKLEAAIGELLEKAKQNPNPENTDTQDEALEDLGEDDFAVNPRKVLNVIKKTSNMSARAFAELQKAVNENKRLNDELEKVKGAESVRASAEKSRAFINGLLDECDDKYGPKFRSAAYEAAWEFLKEEGYNNSDNKPSADAVRVTIKRFYKELADADKTKKDAKEDKRGDGRPKSPFALDTGKGGRVAAGVADEGPVGTDAEVREWMQKNNRWD